MTATDKAAAPKSALAVIFLIVFIDMAGFGIVIPFLPFWAEHYGAAPDVVTLLMASYSAAQFIFAPALGWASDRWGRKPVLLVSILGNVASFVWLAFAGSLLGVFAARLVAGVTGANIAVAQAYVADVTPGEGRARGMGLVGAAIGLGFVFGPAIGGVLAGPDAAHPDFQTPFLAGAAVSAVASLLTLALLREPERHKAAAAEFMTPRGRIAAFASVVGRPAVALPILIVGLITFVMGGMESTFALWAERQLSWGPRFTGYFLTYVGICMALVQGGAIGPLVRRFAEARLVLAALVLFAASMFLIPASTSLALVLVAGALMAVGAGLGQPSLSSLISRSAPQDMQGGVMGASQSAQSLGRIFGPAIAGVLFSEIGRGAPYIAGGVILLLCLLPALRIERRAPAGKTQDEDGEGNAAAPTGAR